MARGLAAVNELNSIELDTTVNINTNSSGSSNEVCCPPICLHVLYKMILLLHRRIVSRLLSFIADFLHLFTCRSMIFVSFCPIEMAYFPEAKETL